ncbi:ImmA/IrrE family metallo-endopeptidase [Brachybacterium sp. NPDC056505]
MVRLIDLAHDHGIRIWWRPMDGRDGQWSLRHRSIWLDPRMTAVQSRSVLAHELGHATYGDDGPQPPHIEERAWRFAARLLVPGMAYEQAETIVGCHPGALADELGVTRPVVLAYREVLEHRELMCA